MCQEGSGDGGVGFEREGCTLFTPDWDGTTIYRLYRYMLLISRSAFHLSGSGNRE